MIGFFDGALTIMGLIMGAYLAGKATNTIVISAGVATALALGISSGWGAYEAERMEQGLIASEKRKALLREENEFCLIDEAHNFAMKVTAIVHALAPIPSAILPLIPYIFLDVEKAFYSAMGISVTLLFLIGVMMGKVSKRNIIKSGMRMVLAGVITLILIIILSPSHVA